MTWKVLTWFALSVFSSNSFSNDGPGCGADVRRDRSWDYTLDDARSGAAAYAQETPSDIIDLSPQNYSHWQDNLNRPYWVKKYKVVFRDGSAFQMTWGFMQRSHFAPAVQDWVPWKARD